MAPSLRQRCEALVGQRVRVTNQASSYLGQEGLVTNYTRAFWGGSIAVRVQIDGVATRMTFWNDEFEVLPPADERTTV